MLILASKSPRRQELLRQAGIDFQVLPATAPEAPWDGRTAPEEYVRMLACTKALQVSAANPDALVLGADTTVAYGPTLFGKPADLQQAEEFLMTLSGKCHQVHTGVAFCRNGKELRSFTVTTAVYFKELTPHIIYHYFQLVNPLDKAGAYGIQEHGELLIDRIEGSWSNVMGLPMEALNETGLL